MTAEQMADVLRLMAQDQESNAAKLNLLMAAGMIITMKAELDKLRKKT